jgi:hypothetical protein
MAAEAGYAGAEDRTGDAGYVDGLGQLGRDGLEAGQAGGTRFRRRPGSPFRFQRLAEVLTALGQVRLQSAP